MPQYLSVFISMYQSFQLHMMYKYDRASSLLKTNQNTEREFPAEVSAAGEAASMRPDATYPYGLFLFIS